MQDVQEVGGRLVVSGETVVVTSNPDDPPRDSSIATKIDTPLLETPRSVSIIDRRTLDDMGAISITQAHDYAVGLTLLDERGPAFARGFPVDFYDLRRDGLRTYSWSVREPVAVDRIQYLRGPSATLYGDGSPGALINMVLKKPLPTPRYEVSASGGSSGFGRVTADLSGPLTAGKGVRYRIIAASEWLDNGFDNDERRLTVLPTIAVDFGARGTLTVDTEWYDQKGLNYRHTVPATAAAQRGDFSGLPWDLGFSGPEYGWTGSNISPGLRLDLTLGRQTSLHVAGRYTKIDGDINGQGLIGARGGWPHGQPLPISRDQHVARVPVRHVCGDHGPHRPSRASHRHRHRSGAEYSRQHDRRRGGVDAGHLQSSVFHTNPSRWLFRRATTSIAWGSTPSIRSDLVNG